MEDLYQLPVSYKGEELEFPFRIVAQGYVQRFVVRIAEVDVVFEPDDSGEYRAIVYDADGVTGKLPERGLLEAISSVIQQLAG